MKSLLEGYQRFRETHWQKYREVFEALATRGQSPSAIVIACSDSRVDPQLIFDAGPGEIFVVRNVANLVPPYAPDSDNHGTSAALEFAVRNLGVRHVIVMGHSSCGGIRALLQADAGYETDFIGPWMAIAGAARARALEHAHHDPEAAQTLCEHESLRISLANLLTFPWIRERVEDGRLQIHGWHFDIETAELTAVEARPQG